MALQQRTVPAVLAIALAIASFFTGHVLGFFLALGAILMGAIGFLLSASPKRRGGPMSLAALALGVVAIVFHIVAGALGLIF
jgi:uncharacterized membrane protein YecN with MAPEG domain